MHPNYFFILLMEMLYYYKTVEKINIHTWIYIYILYKYRYMQNREMHMNKDMTYFELITQLLWAKKQKKMLFNKTDIVDICP